MWDKCLSEKDMGLWGSLCLPATVANGCPLDSYNKLKDVFGGPDCEDLVGGMPSTVSSQSGPSKTSFSLLKESRGHPLAIVDGMQNETHLPMSLSPKHSM